MKKKFGLVLVAILSTGVMVQAQGNPPALPPVPGEASPAVTTPTADVLPTTPAPTPADVTIAPPPIEKPVQKPAAKPTKKLAQAKTTTTTKTTTKKAADKKKPAAKQVEAAPLALNQPAVAKQDNVNVRGQANINSEVVARLKKDQTVMVLEEITLKKPKTDEPAKWAKISMPAGAKVYVNTMFLENNTVKPAKLNLRSGAGENYSVVGLLHKGDTVKPLGTKGDWTEIEAPASAYAFVAAHLLAPAPVVPPQIVAVTPPPPSPATVDTAPTIAPPPTDAPVVPPAEIPQPPVVTAPPVEAPVLPPTLVEAPKEPRIVQREGIVTGTVSIQAPSFYQLKSLDNGNVMDYLHSGTTNVNLKQFKGKRVLVSGEEGLDERWPNTPVLTIKDAQNIQVVE